MEFAKLEKVELGGIKGKMLSHQVVEIFTEFNEIFAVFGNRTYDGLDPTNKVMVRVLHTETSMCRPGKNPYPPRGRSPPRGRVGVKNQILEGSYETKLEFPGWRGGGA